MLIVKTLHPRKDDAGRQVDLKAPSSPNGLESWGDPLERATVISDGVMPTSLNGIDVRSWTVAPENTAGWLNLAAEQTEDFTEPPMTTAPGKPAASGVVILEGDGRVWVVSPSNQHGGYVNTFPKGKLDPGMGLRANALKEGFEESGLQVALTGFLCDSVRSNSVTRYYTARRLGGHPADMCWESQAVHLVPRELLSSFVTHPNDQGVLQALAALG